MITLNLETGKEVAMSYVAIAIEFVKVLFTKVASVAKNVFSLTGLKVFLLATLDAFSTSLWTIAAIKLAMIVMSWIGVITMGFANSIVMSQLFVLYPVLALFLLPFCIVNRAVEEGDKNV